MPVSLTSFLIQVKGEKNPPRHIILPLLKILLVLRKGHNPVFQLNSNAPFLAYCQVIVNIIINIREFENLSVEKKMLSTALGFEPRSIDCRSTKISNSTI